MTQVRNFVLSNFRTLLIVLSFSVSMYVQHVNNTSHIVDLRDKCATLEIKIEDQYERIDAIKLDKAVFEANISQLATIQTDIREMRSDIKELLKNLR